MLLNGNMMGNKMKSIKKTSGRFHRHNYLSDAICGFSLTQTNVHHSLWKSFRWQFSRYVICNFRILVILSTLNFVISRLISQIVHILTNSSIKKKTNFLCISGHRFLSITTRNSKIKSHRFSYIIRIKCDAYTIASTHRCRKVAKSHFGISGYGTILCEGSWILMQSIYY